MGLLDDFFARALIGGIGVAAVAGPLGCFVVWRRMAYFGDTMAHSALLGIALSVLLDIAPPIGVFVVAAALALALYGLQRRGRLPGDALLGILAHSALALGLVIIGLVAWLRLDLMGYLFGDILAVSRADLAVVLGGGAVALAVLALIWRPLLADTVSPELARTAGLKVDRARLVFILLLAAVIAVAIKIVGVLLMTALLVIPAATARMLVDSPRAMALMSAAVGALAVVAGLGGSLRWDTPSGPSIVVAALVLFLIAVGLGRSGPVAADRRAR